MPEDVQQKTLIDRMRTIAIALKWTPISVDTSGATIKMTIESPRAGGTPTPIVTEAPIEEAGIPKVKAEACPDDCIELITDTREIVVEIITGLITGNTQLYQLAAALLVQAGENKPISPETWQDLTKEHAPNSEGAWGDIVEGLQK